MTERGPEQAQDTLAHAPHGHGGAHPPAEEDRVHSRTIVLVGVAALVVFFVASLAAIGAMRRQQRQLLPEGPAPMPELLGSAKIGLLEQRLFEHSNQAEAWRAAQRRRLESYGWVDPAKGVVRMPVERAMQLVLEGARPPASGEAAGAGPGPRPEAGKGEGGPRR